MNIATLPKIFKPFFCQDLIRLGKNFDGGYLINREDLNKSKKLLSFGIGEDFSFENQFVNLTNCLCETYDSSVDIQIDFATHHKQNIDAVNLEKILSNEKPGVFLKCDVEGSEYSLLDALIDHTHLFSGMVIEFHDLHLPQNFNDITNFISKINQKLVHLHVNNYFYFKDGDKRIPNIFELTFTSSNNIKNSFVTIPHNLDMPNNPNDEQFQIMF